MIEQVIALTIEKAANRRWMYQGIMLEKGIPVEAIHFFRGKSYTEFASDYNRIADAAEKDGFSFVRQFQGYGDTGIVQQHPAQMCQLWNYARILRYIVETQKTTLVTWDDRTLTVPFSMLNVIIEQLKNKDKPFYTFQLRLRGQTEYLQLPEEEDDELNDLHAEQFRAYTSIEHEIDYTYIFTRWGFYGYDETIVFSPKGAEWLLTQLIALDDIDADIKKMPYMDISLKQKPLYNSRLNLDNWLCWGLRPIIDAERKADTKGFYCPRYPGYDFIQDAHAFGSDTYWDSKTGMPDHLRQEVYQKQPLAYIE